MNKEKSLLVMTCHDIVNIGFMMKGENDMKTASINTFQMKIPDEVNRRIKAQAAVTGLTKHDWIEKAIREKLEREAV